MTSFSNVKQDECHMTYEIFCVDRSTWEIQLDVLMGKFTSIIVEVVLYFVPQY